MMLLRVVLVLLFFPASGLFGQPLGEIATFGPEIGFASQYVRALAQDDEDALWVAVKAQVGLGGAGLARFKDGRATMFSEANGLRSPQVLSLLFQDDRLYAGTESGLHLFNGSQTFACIGPKLPVPFLAPGVGSLTWGLGLTDLEEPVFLQVQGHTVRRVPGKSRLRRPLGLFVLPSGEVLAVCQSGMILANEKSVREIPLKHTPLWKPAIKDPDGPVPSICLYEAARNGRGDVFIIGHTRRLVRYRDGVLASLAEGHFSGLGVGAAADDVFISDFDGNLFHYDGKGVAKVFNVGASRLGTLFVDTARTLWVEVEHVKAPHEIWCLEPPAYDRVVCRFPLGQDGYYSPGVLNRLEQASGTLWISTNAGLWKLRRP